MNLLLIVVVAVVTAATAGCSSWQPSTPDDGSVDQSAPWFGDTNADLDKAKAGGATAEQVAILEGALRTGRVSFEDYSAAVDQSLRCVREAGFQVFSDKVTVYQGLRMRMYVTQSHDGNQQEPAVEKCIQQHSYYVEKAYQLQPASMEARDQHFAQYRDALIACLTGAGVAVDQQMTNDEIQRAIGEGMDNGVDCMAKTGYDG